MSITYGGSLTSGGNGSNNNIVTASVTPIAGTVTFAFFYLVNHTGSANVSGCNLTWTVLSNTAVNTLKMAWGVGDSPTTGAITCTSNRTAGAWSVFYMRGVDTTTPIVQSPTAAGTGTTSSVTMGAYSSTRSNAVIGCHQTTSNVIFTPTANFTKIHDTDANGRAFQTQYGLGEYSPFSATSSSVTWRAWGIELNEKLSGGNFFPFF